MIEWTPEARALAVRCCADATAGRAMNPELTETIVLWISAWIDTAAQNQRTADYYRGLLDKCALCLGSSAYLPDDGVDHLEPIYSKIPELMAELAAPRTNAKDNAPTQQ